MYDRFIWNFGISIALLFWRQKNKLPQSAFTCSKLTIETLEQGAKYVQS